MSAKCSTCGAEITPLELAWTAGLFEGEGSIRINKPTKRNLGHLVVSVVNTDRDIIDFFQERWPGYMKPATGLRPNQRPAWVWVLAARRAMVFLLAIEPYIVRKAVREKITHGVAFQLAKTSKRPDNRSYEYAEQQWCAYWWMAELNKRGRGKTPQADQHRRKP
jgi:hypothetical protein